MFSNKYVKPPLCWILPPKGSLFESVASQWSVARNANPTERIT